MNESVDAVWGRLRRIAESDLGDDQKDDLYRSVGVDSDQVQRVLSGMESAETPFRGKAERIIERFGEPTNQAQEDYLNWARLADVDARSKWEADAAARLDRMQTDFADEEQWWESVLKAVDKPRAVVVAGFSQLGAVADDWLGFDPDGTKSVASWERFSEQVANNASTASLIDEDMMNPWMRGILGFAVDVALDPLTYLTGGSAAVAKVTGKGGVKAAQIALEAADAATDAGNLVDAARFSTLAGKIGTQGGYSGLQAADRELLTQAGRLVGKVSDTQTLRGGVYFRLPGTEGVRIPVVSEMLTPVSRYSARLNAGFQRTKAGGALRHPFSTPKREFMQQFRSLDLQQQTNALSGLRAVTIGNVKAARYREQMGARLAQLVKASNDLGVDMQDGTLRRFLDAPDAAMADGTLNPLLERVAAEGEDGATAGLLDGWRQWWDDARTVANDLVGEEWLQQVDNYTFHRLQVLDEVANDFVRSGSETWRRTSPEMRRSIQVGRVYRGRQIVDPDQAVAVYGRRLSPEDQAVEILRREGVEVDQLFDDDIRKTAEAYVNVVSSRVAAKTVAREMTADAVAMSKDRFRLFGKGGAFVAKERQLQRARFSARIADFAATNRDLAAAGRRTMSPTVANLAGLVDVLGAVRTGGASVDDLSAGVKRLAGMLDAETDRFVGLSRRVDDKWNEFGREANRLYDTNADEAWDLTVVGVSSSTQRLYGEIAELEDELFALGAGLFADQGQLLRQADALLREQEMSLLERHRFWSEAVDGMRSRRTLPDLELRAQADVELANVERQLQAAGELRSTVNRVNELADRVAAFGRSNDATVDEFRRALTPGSDGVARLPDGSVARFTRATGGTGDERVFDRLGVRFQFADDVDAADARFLGDLAGTNPAVRIRPPDLPVDATRGGVLPPDPEMDALAQQIWDDPDFNSVVAELMDDYKQIVELDEMLADSARRNKTPEVIREAAQKRLEEIKQGLWDVRGLLERLGAGFPPRKGPEYLWRPVWEMDLPTKAYDSKWVKTNPNKYVGGEWDAWNSMPKGWRRHFQRHHNKLHRDPINGKPTAHMSSMTPDVYAAEAHSSRQMGDGSANTFLELVRENVDLWQSLRNEFEAITRELRPKAGNLEDLRDLVKDDLDNQIREVLDARNAFDYSADDLRGLFARINRLGEQTFVDPPPRLFNFTATTTAPLTFTGQTARQLADADLLLAGIRNGTIRLPRPANLAGVDNVFWTQFTDLAVRYAKNPTPTAVDLQTFTTQLNRLIGGYARFDDTSVVARLASGDTPAGSLLDDVVNVKTLSANETAAFGDWQPLFVKMAHTPDDVASMYRNDLVRRGYDSVLVDDGRMRELLALQPASMRGENPQSRLLMKLLDEQARLQRRLGGLKASQRPLTERWGVDVAAQVGDRATAETVMRANAQRARSLSARKGRKGWTQQLQDELLFRKGASDNFKYARQADERADRIEAGLRKAHRDEVRAAQAVGVEPPPFSGDMTQVNALREHARNLRLVAQADAADADLLASGAGRSYDVLFTGKLAEQPGLAEQLTQLMRIGMKELSDTTMAPEEIVNVLRAVEPAAHSDSVRQFLRGWDYLTGVFKTYAVMTPGFINRNVVGGAMNNWLGLVNVKSYPEFYKANRAFHNVVKEGGSWDEGFAAVRQAFGDKGAEAERAFRVWMEVAPAVAGGQAASFATDVGVAAADAIEQVGLRAAVAGTERGLRNQTLRDNAASRAFFYFNTRAEYNIRGPMVWDEIARKGGDTQSAVERVYTYHFDYSPAGASRFERGTLRRVFPFYVWMANNIPLQLKGLVTRPKVAASWLKLQQNIEELSDDEGLVPDYFNRLGAIRLPFKNADGSAMYFMPDLPFRDLGIFQGLPNTLNPVDAFTDLVNMQEVGSAINPLLKVPFETQVLGRKLFTGAPFDEGYVQAPAFLRIPGMGPALALMGQAKKDKNGDWVVRERASYAIESAMPLIARINRAFPVEESGQERRMSALLSMFVGLGFRTNTLREQSNQLFKKMDDLDRAITEQESLGTKFETVSEIESRKKQERKLAELGGYSGEASVLLETINSGSVDAIAELDGFGGKSAQMLADSVSQFGAFTDLEDLASTKDVSVDGVERALVRLREMATMNLDVGSASVKELEAMPNIGEKTAVKIRAYAKQRGGIRSLGELRAVGLSSRQIQELAVWLEEQQQFQRRFRVAS